MVIKRIGLGLVGLILVVGVMLSQVSGEVAYADCAGVDTSILDCGDAQDGEEAISYLLNTVLSVIVYGMGAAGVLGVIVAGIMYMTARDSAEQTSKAKKRLAEVAVGMILFAVGSTFFSWVVPGGLNLMPGGNGGGQTNNLAGGSTAAGGNNGAETATSNREQGSEEVSGENVGVGSGNEGWLETN